MATGTSDSSSAILIFARCPDPGQCKTRLIPALGPDGATALYERLAAHTLDTVRNLSTANTRVRILYTGNNLERLQEICSGTVACDFIPQTQGDLGDRLAAGFQDAFDCGCTRVVAIGTDCPDLTASLLDEALSRLNRAGPGQRTAVIGPAADGGYYLIGLDRPVPELFENVPWGTSDVFRTTLEIAGRKKLHIAELPLQADVDEPEDLPICVRHGLLPG